MKKKVGAKPKPTKQAKPSAKPRLLAGGNPQVAKGDGDAPVQAWIGALDGWKRDVATRFDAAIARAVPAVTKAIRWNSPFYGVAGGGWFAALHVFTRYVRVAFFNGAALAPPPPGPSKSADTRYLDVHEHDALDARQLATWFAQASRLPGWGRC